MGEILASLFESILFSIFLVLFLEPKKGRKTLFLGIVLSLGLLFLYVVVILRFRKKFRHYKQGILMLCYSVLPTFVLIFFVLLTSTLAELYRIEPVLGIKVIGIMVGVHFIVIAAAYLSFHAAGTPEKEYDVEKLHYMLRVQRESIEKFIEQERELYRVRHELEHKLFTVQYLFEKNQKEEGFRVLKQMIVELCGDAKNISVSRNIVETVITNIEKKYETEEIRIEKEIFSPDETIMELVDLCILMGDLLDNAMEAAAGSAEKQVRISVREEFNCLYLQISNTFSEKNSDVKTFVTKKEAGRHGYGIRNIREIVKRYGGELIIYDEGGWFYAAVIIYGQK